jgi:hypothetical protein
VRGAEYSDEGGEEEERETMKRVGSVRRVRMQHGGRGGGRDMWQQRSDTEEWGV